MKKTSSSSLPAANLEPFQILPEQFFPMLGAVRAQLWQPERRLMWGVLEECLLSLVRHYGRAKKPRERENVRADLAWILADDRSYLYSFTHCCEYLGLDSNYLRRGIMEYLQRVLATRQEQQVMMTASATE